MSTIKNIYYNKEDGSIDLEIDNTELLTGRSDIEDSGKTPELLDTLGGIKGKEEEKQKNDLKRSGWKETHKATDVKHVCPVCGTHCWGRPTKEYCSPTCKEVAKKRRRRKRKTDVRDFKPHRGTAGEVYFMYENKGERVITFVPAFNAGSRSRAREYINNTYPEDKRDECIQQINEVIRK